MTNKTVIVGAAELKRKFAQMERKLQTATLVRAAKAGAAIILKRAKELAPRDTGALARALVTRTTRRRKTYGETSVTNTKAGAHAVLQEYGVQPHPIGKGTHPGHKPQPFMRPAFDETKDAARAEVQHQLRRAVLEGAS